MLTDSIVTELDPDSIVTELDPETDEWEIVEDDKALDKIAAIVSAGASENPHDSPRD